MYWLSTMISRLGNLTIFKNPDNEKFVGFATIIQNYTKGRHDQNHIMLCQQSKKYCFEQLSHDHFFFPNYLIVSLNCSVFRSHLVGQYAYAFIKAHWMVTKFLFCFSQDKTCARRTTGWLRKFASIGFIDQ